MLGHGMHGTVGLSLELRLARGLLRNSTARWRGSGVMAGASGVGTRHVWQMREHRYDKLDDA